MSEKKLFEEFLEKEKKVEDINEIRRLVIEAHEMMLNIILRDLDATSAQELQDAFEEYKKVEEEIFKETGDCTIIDLRERIPDNLWHNMIHPEENPQESQINMDGMADEIWEQYQKEKEEEELEEARKNNKIN